MSIKYIYYKTGQGINFGNCHSVRSFTNKMTILQKQGFNVEAEEPDLAKQLERIKNDKRTP